ncbi:hydrogenase maturation protein HypF [Telmatospirillum sp. J64-1]|uniref:Kae1-like domain-containing protein n=1 Tax=Telmatospirillum sp. J64-1 TaxID=2502183 RepID=UPI00115DF656|nr:hydrogenase maturation protein HypF [Telmatospirillum sp. J64-1]
MTAQPYQIVIPLPRPGPSVLAVGAFLKNTICVTRGDKAYLSPVIGDLDSADACRRFEAMVQALCAGLEVEPMAVAHDLHPDFHSTRFAQGLGIPAFAVQHHHAHATAIAAEHGLDAPLLGLSLDGFGLGPGNESWGGELLLVEGSGYRRLGHLALLAQPGGDIAAREPWRMAAAALHRMGRGAEIPFRFTDHKASALLGHLLDQGLNCPPSSSAGRLFDAACGLLDVHPVAEFEGQAPMALEAMATAPEILPGGYGLRDGVLDLLPLLDHLSHCKDAARGANLFHGTLALALADWVAQAAEETGLHRVALGGGCFFNRVLSGLLTAHLREHAIEPLTCRTILPGDQGLSLGQAWIAIQEINQ